MKILFLSAWCPYPADNGSKLRIYHLLRGLSRRHEVNLICFCPEGDEDKSRAAHLRSFCDKVTLLPESAFPGRPVNRLRSSLALAPHSILANHSPAMADLLRRKAAGGSYDVVIASEVHMLPYALGMDGAIILEDLELALLHDQLQQNTSPRRRLRAALTWWKTARYLRVVLRKIGGVTVVSAAERAIAASIVPRHMPLAVVPNGVDLESGAASWPAPQPDRLIYPGALSYEANFDAVSYFLQMIWPRIRSAHPTATLQITGRAAPERVRALPASEGVQFTGYLDDVRPAVAGAWAEVVPLRKGGGTRLKVLEALALGTPVITTSKGTEGLDLQHGRELLVADCPLAFADHTVSLLRSPEYRGRLAEAGRRAAARYDWAFSLVRLEELLQQAVSTHTRGRPSGSQNRLNTE